ncbi:Oidioi.mRNA.OKI2018_I69.XSR.g16415.t1.cds [Oikopleura dioica]|uniref:Oidioi.mRNA.OKI2018_I69.XSR.g16415.t1.cds n=1 Tax=Oikopleura dioica TaxID=34765 RepID=A0ABN7SL48_OIKDI|nr:Oidioi.mRNA.OKI2018_I69.XSR.g16415.t1.cds [Oikopleura dioica]
MDLGKTEELEKEPPTYAPPPSAPVQVNQVAPAPMQQPVIQTQPVALQHGYHEQPRMSIVQPMVTPMMAAPIVTAPMVLQEQSKGSWKYPNVCDLCCDKMCWYAWCCTPCIFGEIGEKLGHNYCDHWCLGFWCGIQAGFCFVMAQRWQIRERYNIQQVSFCGDYCTYWYLPCCMLAQNWHQLH